MHEKSVEILSDIYESVALARQCIWVCSLGPRASAPLNVQPGPALAAIVGDMLPFKKEPHDDEHTMY